MPDISFSCDGQITNWTMAAELDTRENQYPQLQIWQPSGIRQNEYNRTGATELTVSASVSTNVHSGIIDPPLHFTAGDIPGLYVPRSRDSVLSIFVLNGFGRVNYIFDASDSGSALSAITITEDSSRVIALPLISLVLGVGKFDDVYLLLEYL